QSQPLMNETNLNLALSTARLNSDGDVICGVPVAANDFGFITNQGTNCVPVDFFADSIFTGGPNGEGAFATEDERRFLIGERTNRTAVEQMLASIYFTGDLFEVPAGQVSTAFGGEYRRDRIKSSTDFLSAIGENAGENPGTEEATNGSRDIWDVYAEVYVPVLENLSVEGAVRFTDEENFGSETTYRARGSYTPIDWITISGSYGTSFRAPNLREAFLAPQQQGVGSDADPCAVPGEAQSGGVYMPGDETRSQTVLDNCVLSGADPTALGLVANINIPVTVGGNALDLQPETSEAYTATLQFSPPIDDRYQLDFAISWYQITVQDNIRSIDPVTIMNRCYDEPGLTSPFCSRLTRADNPGANFDFINFIDASFVNVGEEVSEGIDLNARFGTDFGGIDFGWNGVATFLTERTEQIFPEDPVNDLAGDYGFPETSLQSTFSFGLDEWELLVNARWFDSTFPSNDALLNLSTAFNCAGPGQQVNTTNTNFPGSPDTYLVCDADAVTYWDTALTYRGDSFTITGGINNLFDEEPPLVDPSVGSNRGGRITSSGYDQIGRTFFVGVSKTF
ncbi:MAG: TonB-dependent receptor, partial [Maricaulaceae bacterium]